jgi:hypothetical protein
MSCRAVHSVTLRCLSEAKASKGDGPEFGGRASFEARKGVHLRMTVLAFVPGRI